MGMQFNRRGSTGGVSEAEVTAIVNPLLADYLPVIVLNEGDPVPEDAPDEALVAYVQE